MAQTEQADPGTKEPSSRPEVADEETRTTFRRSVEEGRVRLGRTWPGMAATGFVGGLDIGIGLTALLVVEEATGSRMLGALAFGIGFLALALGRSELFTENFLVPVTAVVARDATVSALLRLWGTTLVANLAGGLVIANLLVGALETVRPTAIEVATHYTELPASEQFLLALLGGVVITLMTWMQRGGDSELGVIAAAWAGAFVLAAAPLNHVIVVSVGMFAALAAGAPFGYADWAAVAALGGLGNLVGGLALVTLLRLVQVGRDEILRQRSRPVEADPHG